jgi:hypothetical protein
MSNPPRVGDLEVQQDLAYQRREWTFQRAGWAVMSLFTLAALLGLLGHGPLSSTSVSSPDGLVRMDYQRFLHHHAPEALQIYIGGEAANAGIVRLVLDSEYLAGIAIRQVTPVPDRVESGPGQTVYIFRVNTPPAWLTVTFHFEPERCAFLVGSVGVDGRETASFRQFVYP